MKYLQEYRFNIFSFIVIFCVVFYFFYNISYTDDYFVYEWNYYHDKSSSYSDIGFIALENFSRNIGLSFREFLSAAIFLELVLFSFICIRFNANPAFCLVFFVCINYVQMANQLRYYLAFPLFVIASYYLLYEKKRYLGITLSVISFLLHSGIIVLMGLYPLYLYIIKKETKIKNIIKLYFIVGFVCFIGFKTGFEFLIGIESKYEVYSTLIATPLGTSYALLTPFYYLSVITLLIKKVRYTFNNSLLNFSLVLAYFPIIWSIASIVGIQIINARYVNIFLIIWVICIYRLVKISKFKAPYFLYGLIIIGAIILKYGLTFILFGASDFDKIVLILASKSM